MILLDLTPVLLSADHDHTWLWPLFPFAWLLVFVLLFRFLWWPRRWRGHHEHHTYAGRRILAERYARGEIGVEEYRKRLADLDLGRDS
jgi:putative membrane protein